MGEAKTRRAADPSYGKPKRGLVIGPPTEIKGNRILAKTWIDEQELRSALLFFDKLVWPTNRFIMIEGGADELFLQQAGILSRPDYTYNGEGGAIVARGYIQAFLDLNESEPGQWAMAHGRDSLILHDYALPTGSGTAIELLRAIPVPERDTPIAEILEFKKKRYDELLNLRTELDNFIADVNASADRASELGEKIKQIDHACSAVLRVCSEWQFPVRLSSIKANVELRPFVTLAGGVAGFEAAQYAMLPVSGQIMSGLLGAAAVTAPALKVSADLGWRGLKRPSSPFRYVASYHNYLF